MAGDWIKLQTCTPDKPEVYVLADSLNLDPDAVVGKLVRIWCWADAQTIDGNCNAVSVTKSLLDRVTGVTGFAEALVGVGWLEKTDSGFRFPNFDRHNGKTAKTRALGKNRIDSHRSRNDSVTQLSPKCNAPSVTDALPEKRREEKSNTNTEKPSRTANVFVAPSVSEVAEYVKEIGAVVDALDFVNYYTSNGWMVGRSKMKDWKAAVRTWNSKRLKPDDQYDEDPKFMRLLRIATQKGTSNECDVEWRRNNMSQEERDAVRVNCIRFETLADAKLHPLERKRIAKLYITTLRGMESLKNG